MNIGLATIIIVYWVLGWAVFRTELEFYEDTSKTKRVIGEIAFFWLWWIMFFVQRKI